MKVPVSWLKEYVTIDDTLEGLVDALTFSGIEVEGVETIGGDLTGLVVGEVIAVETHPNADRLRLCTVNTGSGETRVVCGAPNVDVGGKYPFAPIGVTLPNGIKLKKAKIRGEVSEGMLCAEDELGLSGEHDELLALDAGLAAGTPMSDVLGPPEIVLDLEITPNRPDSLCLIGVARELATLYGAELKKPEATLTESGESVEAQTKVEVLDAEGCPRYTARVLHNITLGPAPDWMQQRLKLAGIRPINNVVDITNYVMLETGQPLHAFDKKLLGEERIEVRRAKAGEKMHTLDDIERELEDDMLVIADADRAVAVAGVMGGAGSEIRDETDTVLLESAHFDPPRVRSTARRLGLSTESSYRFERGVDINAAEYASRRAAALMVEFAGATVSPGVIDVYPTPPAPRSLSCRYDKINALIGIDIPPAEVRRIFATLELRVTDTDEASCTVEIPTFRGDLTREVDLIEEVARVHGLDKIPALRPRAELVPDAEDHQVRDTHKLRDRMVGLGLREIVNYSYLSPAQLDGINPTDRDARVILPNPLSQDQSVLRTSLLPQMVESLGRNATRQMTECAFFEMGTTYAKAADRSHHESTRLAVGLLGPTGRTGIDRRRPVEREDMFLWLKGAWESLAAGQQLAKWTQAPTTHPAMIEGLTVELRAGKQTLGVLGILRPQIASEWRIHQPVGLFEVEVQPLLGHDRAPVALKPVAVYPATSRDVALLVDTSVSHDDVLNIVKKVAPKELETVELFDIFTGEGIGNGKRSLAYSFSYRSVERTLTDDEANGFHDKVKQALLDGLQAEIRDH